jgi:hypothetical protein
MDYRQVRSLFQRWGGYANLQLFKTLQNNRKLFKLETPEPRESKRMFMNRKSFCGVVKMEDTTRTLWVEWVKGGRKGEGSGGYRGSEKGQHMGSHGSSGPGAGRLLYIKHIKVLQITVQYGSALRTRYLPVRKF